MKQEFAALFKAFCGGGGGAGRGLKIKGPALRTLKTKCEEICKNDLLFPK